MAKNVSLDAGRCWRPILAFVCLLALGSQSVAQRPRIRLDSAYPPVCTVGKTSPIRIGGELTDAATELVFSHPGITAVQRLHEPTEYSVAHRRPNEFDVFIDSEVPPGRYEVRALGEAGLSAPRFLLVGALPSMSFDAGGNSRQEPFAIDAGQFVAARARAEQRDWYRFSATDGESLLIQVWADRIDSRMDAILSVYDANTSERLVHVRQGLSRDPIITFSPPAAGEYLIEVRDATYQGGDQYPYVLEVSQRPHVEAIYPPVARPNETASFTVYGHNLPGGTAVSGDATGLQSLDIQFAPQFNALPFSAALGIGDAAAARLQGGSVALPAPLQGQYAFMTVVEHQESDVTADSGDNDLAANAQSITVPAEVAGQFYPRRDMDWFQFEATKGEVFLLSVATDQLGTNADPVLRVVHRKMVDGKPQLRDIATVDDLEPRPNSRDSRRFFSGSVDCVHQLRIPETGTYLACVVDNYNTVQDDPRLVYQLSIRKHQPAFSLVAFPDPERHPNERIAQPNGVSLLPGGSASIRVRILPEPGFQSDVDVVAANLPDGVSASPLTLSSQVREGLLVLHATREATPSLSNVQIRGVAELDGRRLVQDAKTGAIRRGVNNTDSEAASVRLTHDLSVAIVGETPAGVSFEPDGTLQTITTSVGGKVRVPLRLARSDAWKDREVEVVGHSLPKGFKVAAAKSKTDTVEAVVSIADPKTVTGIYTVPLVAKLKGRLPRNAVVVREAKADLKKVTDLLADRERAMADAKAKLDAAVASLSELANQHAAMEQQTREPRNKLSANLAAQQKAAEELSERLEALTANPGDAALQAAVVESEQKLQKMSKARLELLAKVPASLARLAELADRLEKSRQVEGERRAELERRKAIRDAASGKLTEVKERVASLSKEQLEKEVEFWQHAPSVRLQVQASPVRLVTKAEIDAAIGSTLNIPVIVERDFGFDGQLTLQATFPPESGLPSNSVVLGGGLKSAKLPIHVSKTAKAGVWRGNIEYRLKFNGVEIADKSPCTLTIKADGE